jgi:N-acylneuraminate cytidylyltransferase
MIDGKRVLAVIPARGGSKGVPRKNVRALRGKPLIAWTIEAAAKSALIDRLITSSEDAEILEVARRFGCETPFVRPAELSADDTPGMAPIRHALTQLPGYDYIVVLQPTSPLRVTADIDGCIGRCSSSGADSCVSMTLAQSPPQWMYVKQDGFFVEPFLKGAEANVRRQEVPAVFALNGAVYAARSAWIETGHSFLEGRVACYEMPPERSLDVDTEWDWHVLSRIVDDREVDPPASGEHLR